MSRAMTQMRGVPCSGSGLSCFVSRLVVAWCLAPDLSCQTHQRRSFRDLTEGMQIKRLVFRISFFLFFHGLLCYVDAWGSVACNDM